MATRLELELKYRVRERAGAERLLTAEALAGLPAASPVRSAEMEDRYIDTTDGALARAGYAARIRREPGVTIVSVKALRRLGGDGAVAGGIGDGVSALHSREELEGPADRGAPPSDWPPSAARALILELCGDAPLVEVVTIRQLRRRRAFAAEGAELELSLDDVDVVSRGELVDRFTELEVELRSGDPAWLGRIAEVLEREEGLEAATTSKYEAALLALGRPVWEVVGTRHAAREIARGAPAEPEARASSSAPAAPGATAAPTAGPAAAAPTAGPATAAPSAGPATAAPAASEPDGSPAPAVAPAVEASTATAAGTILARVGKSPGVTADDTVAEAGRKVLRFHFARLLASEEGARAGTDPEDLHRMRVATRRLRAAWRIFGDAYLADRTRRFPRELRALGRRLGAVRDLDVLIEGLDRYRAELPEPQAAALDPLAEAWRARRDTARSALLRELDSDGYRRFVADFEAFVATDGADVRPVEATEPHHVRDTAPSRIWRAHERVRAYEGVLPWADVATLHELRIAAKWLRYSIEFVREALGPEVSPLVERVVGLQDHLGFLHDADVAAQLTRAFLVERGAGLQTEERDAIAAFLGVRERELVRLRRTAGPPWRRVAGRSFRSTLARCLARL